jgi:drug/metabolite transporter (DMT)-like permease
MQTSLDVLLGVGIGLLTAFLWGISTNIYKSQSDEATPLAISAIKMWLSGIVMTILVFLPFRTGPFNIPFTSIGFLIASVTIGLVIGDLVYLISQERIGVSHAFPIANIFPITTYIIAIFLVGEELIISRFLGVIIAIIGIALISNAQKTKNEDINFRTDFLGIGLALFAALCWSLGSVFLQIGVEGVDPLDANFIRMAFGSLVMLPLIFTARQRGMPTPSKRSINFILVGGFLGMTLGSLLYTYAVNFVGAAVSSLLGSTAPLFALPISILILKEKYTHQTILGALLTVIGVILVVTAV